MKYPISLNEQDLKDLQELGDLLGLGNLKKIYGGVPKVIKISIKLALKTVHDVEKAIPDLDPIILDLLLSAIKRKKQLKYLAEKEEKRDIRKGLV